MHLKEVQIDASGPGRARLTGVVAYDREPGEERFWFEVPERFAAGFAESGNPWLLCLAPLAATLGEPLRIDRPVDRLLARNVRELLEIWKAWYPRIQAVPLELETVETPAEAGGRRTGAFFSGGVDSFFTVLRHTAPAAPIRVQDLVLVRGFDFPLEFGEAFDRHHRRMSDVADQLGLELVDVATNLRETRLRRASWASLWHGSALGTVGLALERRYRCLLIASSSTFGELDPYGSHPMTDPLYSSSETRFLHDGAEATRLDKIGRVASSELALRFLHVCFRETSELNCGRCRKCLLAMLGLTLSGAGERCVTFRSRTPDPARVRRLLFTTEGQRHGVRRLRALARKQGRRDVVRALNRALRRSAVVGRALLYLHKATRVPAMAGAAVRLRRALLAGVVR